MLCLALPRLAVPEGGVDVGVVVHQGGGVGVGAASGFLLGFGALESEIKVNVSSIFCSISPQLILKTKALKTFKNYPKNNLRYCREEYVRTVT